MKKLIIFVFTLLCGIPAFSQDTILKNKIAQELAKANREIVTSRVADAFADHLLRENEYGDEYLDQALDSDSSWYYMLDLYVNEDKNEIIDSIKNDEAGFRDVNVKNSSISIAYNGTEYVVIIVSYIQ